MPEHLRTLAIILVLATGVFGFAKAPACASAMMAQDFVRRRNLWFGVTLAVFLAHNFWAYIILVATLLLFTIAAERNRLALYFLLLFAVPPIRSEIGGMGIVNFLFAIDYLRLLSLVVLLPSFLSLHQQKGVEPFGRNWPDKMLAGYLVLQFCLVMQASNFTNTIRVGAFYPFLDIFLPYYVASRSMRNLQDFRDVLMSYSVAALILSAAAVFEFTRHWLLYNPLTNSLGVSVKQLRYLGRGEDLRAVVTAGEPISLGYAIAVAFSFFLYLKKLIPGPRSWWLGMGLLLVGLYAPISRGPWVGAAVIVLLFALTGSSPGRRLAQLAMVGTVAISLLSVLPIGDKVINYLPWIGTAETKTVDYREALILQSVDVIMRNPFFGASETLNAPEFQDLATGAGFIDIVNTYVSVALTQGLIGLFFFLGVFAAVIFGCIKVMRQIKDKGDERYVLGQGLFSALIGILVMIGTVSSISIVPKVYWSVVGLAVAYVRMLMLGTETDEKPAEAAKQVNTADRMTSPRRG